ncbi:hypothetical protein F5879DRAFT_921717 [Lentinula edodes]|nr:hypothetical protein F5879DRAFT_921717 [Lentinula edodes]
MSTHSTTAPLSPELLLRAFAYMPIACLPRVALVSKHIRSLVYVDLYGSVPSSSLPSLVYVTLEEIFPGRLPKAVQNIDRLAVQCSMYSNVFKFSAVLTKLMKSKLVALDVNFNSLVIYPDDSSIGDSLIMLACSNPSLQILQLSLHSNSAFQGVFDNPVFSFPMLHSFSYTSPNGSIHIHKFLRRHEQLRSFTYKVDEYAMSESSDIMDFVMLPNLSTFTGSPSSAYVICNSHFRMTDNLCLEIEDDQDPYLEKLLEILNHLQAVRKLILNIKRECATDIIYKFLNACPFLTFIGCKVVPLSNITEDSFFQMKFLYQALFESSPGMKSVKFWIQQLNDDIVEHNYLLLHKKAFDSIPALLKSTVDVDIQIHTASPIGMLPTATCTILNNLDHIPDKDNETKVAIICFNVSIAFAAFANKAVEQMLSHKLKHARNAVCNKPMQILQMYKRSITAASVGAGAQLAIGENLKMLSLLV